MLDQTLLEDPINRGEPIDSRNLYKMYFRLSILIDDSSKMIDPDYQKMLGINLANFTITILKVLLSG